jgi:hypothetical protein
VLVRTTFTGDTDLDGDVDILDGDTTPLHFTGLNPPSTVNLHWQDGDFDYDGKVSFFDAGLPRQNCIFAALELATVGLTHNKLSGLALGDWPQAVQNEATYRRSVPEPAAMLVAMAALMMTRRQSRRNQWCLLHTRKTHKNISGLNRTGR